MSIDLIANLAYILAAALFIFGLKMLGSPATAKRGNLLSSTAMLIAVVSGLISADVVSYEIIVGGMLVGGVVGGEGGDGGGKHEKPASAKSPAVPPSSMPNWLWSM